MKEKPEVIQFADDRPMSLGDDLYQWAIDAEDTIRDMQSRLEELNQEVEELEKENASLKQDAARWREILTNDAFVVYDEEGGEYRKCKLELVIDTAMQANKGE